MLIRLAGRTLLSGCASLLILLSPVSTRPDPSPGDGSPLTALRGRVHPTVLEAMSPGHHRMAHNVIRRELPASLPAVCWDEGSDPHVFSWFSTEWEKLHLFEFNDNSRWSTTATDGGGLGQGDPTTLTWGFVADGTNVMSGVGEPVAPSNLIAFLDGIYGSGPGGTDYTQRPWFQYFQMVFDDWASFIGVNYVYEPNDDGKNLPGGGSSGSIGVRPDVRIGGHYIDGTSNILAYNYFPNTGDMVIDTGDGFFGNTTQNSLRLRNVLAHEHGHGLGIEHVCPVNQTKLMEPTVTTAFDGPQTDDILAGRRGYGDAYEFPVENDSPGTATDLGAMAFGESRNRSVAIDDAADEDFFAFTVPVGAMATVRVIPLWSIYLSGPELSGGCTAGTSFYAHLQSDLALELRDTGGAGVLASANAFGPGGTEEVVDVPMADGAGTYYARVTGTANASQAYGLLVFVNEMPVPNQAPVAACRNVFSCDGNVVAADVDDGSLDPDGDPLTLSLEPASPYPPGATAVELIAYDGELADTCQAVVTVNQAPVAVCQNVGVLGDSLGCQVDVAPAQVDAGSSDPDGGSLSLSLVPAGPYDEGETNVLFIVADSCGAADTCNAVITVTCPDGPALEVSPASVTFATVAWGDTACGKITLGNTGDLPMDVVSVTGCDSGGFFTVQDSLTTPVAPGDSTCFTVCFTPVENGSDTCTVTVVTGDSTAAVTVVVGTVTSTPGAGGKRSVALSPAFPNPFSAGTRVRFSLTEPAPVRLTVFDLRGRRVREVLRDAVYGAGDHEVAWDGRNAAGADVAAGIYLIRVVTPRASAVVRAVRTR